LPPIALRLGLLFGGGRQAANIRVELSLKPHKPITPPRRPATTLSASKVSRADLPTLFGQFLVNQVYHHGHRIRRAINGGGKLIAGEARGVATDQVDNSLSLLLTIVGKPLKEKPRRRRKYFLHHGQSL
jgi:hypothetical protein